MFARLTMKSHVISYKFYHMLLLISMCKFQSYENFQADFQNLACSQGLQLQIFRKSQFQNKCFNSVSIGMLSSPNLLTYFPKHLNFPAHVLNRVSKQTWQRRHTLGREIASRHEGRISLFDCLFDLKYALRLLSVKIDSWAVRLKRKPISDTHHSQIWSIHQGWVIH